MRKYLVEVALNKEGIATDMIFEMPEYPCTLRALEDAKRAMFDKLCAMWSEYRDNSEDRRLLMMSHYEDWINDIIHRYAKSAICWSADRDINSAHITIHNRMN